MSKLPKQWRHWCRKAGLRPYCGGMRRYEWFYLKGHGRVWRLNCLNMLQCGDSYADFSKWALCDIEQTPCPTNEAQFLAAVRELLALKSEREHCESK